MSPPLSDNPLRVDGQRRIVASAKHARNAPNLSETRAFNNRPSAPTQQHIHLTVTATSHLPRNRSESAAVPTLAHRLRRPRAILASFFEVRAAG